jgi:hypothetical protein
MMKRPSRGIFEIYFEDMKQQVVAALRVPPGRLGLTMPELPGPQLLLPERCTGDCPVCGEDKEVIGNYGEELWPCCYCVTKECCYIPNQLGLSMNYGLDH